MFKLTSLRSLLLGLLLLAGAGAHAQPLLPDIAGAHDKGLNILSWICQYDGIKSIAVQRSSDSVFNYITVGYVKDFKKGPQAFIDGHPNPGKNWYKLYIVFNSDLTWTSNRFKIVVDSASLMNARVLPPNDSLQKLAANIRIETKPAVAATTPTTTTGTTTNTTTSTTTNASGEPVVSVPRIVIDIPEDATAEGGFSYVKSQYVYTNPFTGHINLELPEYKERRYSVLFFNSNDKQVLEVAKVTEAQLIIDKRNFQKKGIYKFELKQDRKVVETGYITIY